MEEKQGISPTIFHILKDPVIHHCNLQSILYFKLFLKILDIGVIFVLCCGGFLCQKTELGALCILALVGSIVNFKKILLVVKSHSDNFKANLGKYESVFLSLAKSLKRQEQIQEGRKQVEACDVYSDLDKIHVKEQFHFLKDVINLITVDAALLLMNSVSLMKIKKWTNFSSDGLEWFSLIITLIITTVEYVCMILKEPLSEESAKLKYILMKIETSTIDPHNCSTHGEAEGVEQLESTVNKAKTSENGVLNDSGFNDYVEDHSESLSRDTENDIKTNMTDGTSLDCNAPKPKKSVKMVVNEGETSKGLNSDSNESSPEPIESRDRTEKHSGETDFNENAERGNAISSEVVFSHRDDEREIYDTQPTVLNTEMVTKSDQLSSEPKKSVEKVVNEAVTSEVLNSDANESLENDKEREINVSRNSQEEKKSVNGNQSNNQSFEEVTDEGENNQNPSLCSKNNEDSATNCIPCKMIFKQGTFNLNFNFTPDTNVSFIYMKNPRGKEGILADHYCKYSLSPGKKL